jgi:gluconolactonase
MKRFLGFVYTFVTLLSVLPVAAQLIPQSVDFWKIVPKDVKVNKLISDFKFTEGPLWNKKENFLIFSDIPANKIYKVLENGRFEVYISPSENSNGLTYDAEGNLLICEQKTKSVAKISSKTGKKEILASRYEGKTFNSPNDIVCKKDGSFFFSDPPYGHMQFNAEQPRDMNYTGVYYVSKGKITLIDSSLVRANGVCLSPDEKTLYVAQSEFKYLFKSYQLDESGKVLSSKIFFEGDDITGNPDGIKVDVEGNVYFTANNGIMIFNKDGKWLGTIKTPENPANLAWGGKDFKTLFVTCQGSIYTVKLNIKGFSLLK